MQAAIETNVDVLQIAFQFLASKSEYGWHWVSTTQTTCGCNGNDK
jgi:hypothetical protein